MRNARSVVAATTVVVAYKEANPSEVVLLKLWDPVDPTKPFALPNGSKSATESLDDAFRTLHEAGLRVDGKLRPFALVVGNKDEGLDPEGLTLLVCCPVSINPHASASADYERACFASLDTIDPSKIRPEDVGILDVYRRCNETKLSGFQIMELC